MADPGGLPEEVDVSAHQCPTWENIPKRGVLIFEPKSRGNQGLLLRSVTSDFQFNEEVPTDTVYIFKNPSDDYFTLYEKTERAQQSPWKGMNSLLAGRPLLQTDPESTHPLIWIIERICKEPKNLSHAGISMLYQIEEEKTVTFEFYLKKAKIQDTVMGSLYSWRENFRNKSQVSFKNIIKGPYEGFNSIRELDEIDRQNELDIEKLYVSLDKYQKMEPRNVPVYRLNSKNLKSFLLPYQKDTVRWMLHRELKGEDDWSQKFLEYEIIADCFYYPYLGIICHNLPSETDRELSVAVTSCSVKGGILADEMGLGKTVQMLSLISTHQRHTQPVILTEEDAKKEKEDEKNSVRVLDLEEEDEEDHREQMERINCMSFAELSNARASQSSITYTAPPEGTDEDIIQCTECKEYCVANICGIADVSVAESDFICPECTHDKKRHSIRTTLIIVPESLVFQWSTEIQKHCSKDISAMFYFGVKKHGYIPPCELNKYDVVLTTYDTLRNELNFSESKNNGLRKNLRTANTQALVITSLVHVTFWRVIVDESQTMPQSLNSHISKMLMKIHSVHWWCVTGTPLSKNISDFLPLFTFLDLAPFSIIDYFNCTVIPEYLYVIRNTPEDAESIPFNLLLDILSKCVSRKLKKDVESQLALPELIEIEKRIAFTAIEERQYQEEKERLKRSVERSIRAADNATQLKNLNIREKVLQELRSLREIVLTGQTNKADLTTSGCIYAPETVIFRLVVSKKKKLLEQFRLFVMAANALAGVHILSNEIQRAQEDYQYTLNIYKELLDVETFISSTIGADKVKELYGPDEKKEKEYFDETSNAYQVEGDDEDEFKEEQPAAEVIKEREMIKLWKDVERMKKTYEIQPSSTSSSSTSNAGPAPKKIKIEVEEEKKEESSTAAADITDMEEEDRQRAKHARKMARMALKPMKMDVTQEVHLILNMHSVQRQLKFSKGNLIDTQRVEPLLERRYGMEVGKMSEMRRELASIGEAFNAIDLITPTTTYIKSHYTSRPEVFYYKYSVVTKVEREIIPFLPVNLLYEERNAKLKEASKHNPKTCMGGCSAEHKEAKRYLGMKNEFLTMEGMVDKLCGWMEQLEARRIGMVDEMNELMGVVEEMSRPSTLINVLITPINEIHSLNEPSQKMLSFFQCQHSIIKGTKKETEAILSISDKSHCHLCNTFAQLCRLQFDAGFTSFHGHEREKSGVFVFAKYVVDELIPRADTFAFLRETVSPLFTRINDLICLYKKSIENVMLELINTFDEFYQAKSTITRETVVSEMSLVSQFTLEEKYEAYAARSIANRTEHLKKFRTELAELRYLANLMKEQLSGEGDNQECPVCKCQIESFMVYTCGHRICPDCYDHLRTRAKREYNYDSISCPSCRTTINCHQVMLARSGFAEQDAVVPGMIISAKLSTAILLMRELLELDHSNKTILFTQVDPSSPRVWGYLQKVLRLAKLPFMAMTRNQFGKKIADFDLGNQNRILLCSLSLCANGLNITGANNIIFLDPPHQKSVLQQAMGRINRFGQKNAMRVYHIVVEGSLDVELRLAAQSRSVEDEKKGWTVGDIKQMFGIADVDEHEDPIDDLHDDQLHRIIEGRLFDARVIDLLMDDDDEGFENDMQVHRRQMEAEMRVIRERMRQRIELIDDPQWPMEMRRFVEQQGALEVDDEHDEDGDDEDEDEDEEDGEQPNEPNEEQEPLVEAAENEAEEPEPEGEGEQGERERLMWDHIHRRRQRRREREEFVDPDVLWVHEMNDIDFDGGVEMILNRQRNFLQRQRQRRQAQRNPPAHLFEPEGLGIPRFAHVEEAVRQHFQAHPEQLLRAPPAPPAQPVEQLPPIEPEAREIGHFDLVHLAVQQNLAAANLILQQQMRQAPPAPLAHPIDQIRVDEVVQQYLEANPMRQELPMEQQEDDDLPPEDI